MIPLLTYLLFIPGVFLGLPLLSVVTGWVCARRMAGVSRVFGLLTGCACGAAVFALMLFRVAALNWVRAEFGVDLPWPFFPLLTAVIAAAGITVTWGICRLRRSKGF